MKKKCVGSLTIEAAVVVPLFLMAMGIFVFFFQVLLIQSQMEAAIDSAGRRCAIYWHGTELIRDYKMKNQNNPEEEQHVATLIEKVGESLLKNGVTVLYVQNEVLKQLDEVQFFYEGIDGGKDGISFLGSGLAESGNVLKILVTYDIKVPFLPETTIRCMQSGWKRVWNGERYEAQKENEEAEEGYVYVTKNGTVYHITLECSHLKRTISTVTIEQIKTLKNESGQSYRECSMCCERTNASIYYVTKTGDRYHVTLSCASLVRYIEKRPLSEIGTLKGCSRCASV